MNSRGPSHVPNSSFRNQKTFFKRKPVNNHQKPLNQVSLTGFMGYLDKSETKEWNERFKLSDSSGTGTGRLKTNIGSHMLFFFHTTQAELKSGSSTSPSPSSARRNADLGKYICWQDQHWCFLGPNVSEHSAVTDLLVSSVQNCGRKEVGREHAERLLNHLNWNDVLKPGESNERTTTDVQKGEKKQLVYFEEEESQESHEKQKLQDLTKSKVKNVRQTKRHKRNGKTSTRNRQSKQQTDMGIEFVAEYRPRSPPITDERFTDLRSRDQMELARKLDDVIARLEKEIGSRKISTKTCGAGWRNPQEDFGLEKSQRDLLVVSRCDDEGKKHKTEMMGWDLGFNFEESVVVGGSESEEIIPPSPKVTKRGTKRKGQDWSEKRPAVLEYVNDLGNGMKSPLRSRVIAQEDEDNFEVSPVFNRSIGAVKFRNL